MLVRMLQSIQKNVSRKQHNRCHRGLNTVGNVALHSDRRNASAPSLLRSITEGAVDRHHLLCVKMKDSRLRDERNSLDRKKSEPTSKTITTTTSATETCTEQRPKSCEGDCDGQVGPGESLQLQRTILDDDIIRRELRYVLLDDASDPEIGDEAVIQKALLGLFMRANELNRENPDVEFDLVEFVALQNESIEQLRSENAKLVKSVKEKIDIYDELVILNDEINAIVGEDPFIDHLRKRLKVLIDLNDPIDDKMRSLHYDIAKFVPEVRNLIAEIEAYRQSGADLSDSKLALIEKKTKELRKVTTTSSTAAPAPAELASAISTRGERVKRKKKKIKEIKEKKGRKAHQTCQKGSECDAKPPNPYAAHQSCHKSSHLDKKKDQGEEFDNADSQTSYHF